MTASESAIEMRPRRGSTVAGSRSASTCRRSADGAQLPLRELGRGKVGDGGPYAHLPLL